jgi:hypothetical protein
MKSMSTLPEHMIRMSLISSEYCSRETPAVSAAPYAHQWHTKPMIFGLNSLLELIFTSLDFYAFSAAVSICR